MAAPVIDGAGNVQFPPNYAVSPVTGPLEFIPIPPDIVTADVIAADLANIYIGFARWLAAPTPGADPNVSITAAQDADYAQDREAMVVANEADGATLNRIGEVMGLTIAGNNEVGYHLGLLIKHELFAGDGTGFKSVSANLDFYKSTYFGPNAQQAGSTKHFLDYVASGMSPADAFITTYNEAPFHIP
ncbi:MAG: hypothetical protein AB7F35_07695 [Acetobacteraceae bacterium]